MNYDGPDRSRRLKLNQQKGGDITNTPAGDNGDDDISIHSSGEADHSEEYRDIDANPQNSSNGAFKVSNIVYCFATERFPYCSIL